MRNYLKHILFSCLVIFVVTLQIIGPAVAVNPDEVLDDPQLEERARDISANLRCLVCQNQSIDDSDAQLAKDLRLLVRERLVAGETDQQVIDFVVARYGEFVLLTPTLSMKNLLLWGTPIIALLLGSVLLFRIFSARKTAAYIDEQIPLTEEELQRLDELLDQQKDMKDITNREQDRP